MSFIRTARTVIEEREVSSTGSEQDQGKGIKHFAGNPLRIEVMFVRNNTILNDANITGVSATVKAVTLEGGDFVTVDTNAYNSSLTIQQWNDRTAQNAVLEFSAAEMELPIPDGQISQGYRLVFYFGDNTFGWIDLLIHRDGVPSGMLPTQENNIIPNGATYDGSGEYMLAVTEGKFYIVDFNTNDDELDNDGETVDTSLEIFQASDSFVTLKGDAGQPVTAIVRPNPIANTALVQQIAATQVATIFNYVWIKESNSANYCKVNLKRVGDASILSVDESSRTTTPTP